ncbi:MAG TPA: XdhC family protein [Verrucomicrobiae bacterium]|nr:XdhC family protein [Verrucomicrobiae bacterium]
MKELLEICRALKTLGGQPCALATVIKVEGSAYRRPGARMLITLDGQSWGMISGGCLEHDILSHAQGVLETGQPCSVRYDSTSRDDIIFGTGLGCNGIIDIFIQPVTESFGKSLIEAVERCQETRQQGAIATVVTVEEISNLSGQHAILGPEGWEGHEGVGCLLKDHFSDNELIVTGKIEDEEVSVFVQPLLPPLQLVVFGGWLDVLPLIRLAKETGFQVCVVDSRRRESSLEFFQEANFVLLCSPHEALSQIQFDDRTMAVLMNHNFECDQEALEALAQVSVPFVGMLGPSRRKQRLLEAVKNNGISLSNEFEKSLHGPAGLDIGANTPQEIALSILAEILAVFNGRNAKPIRDRVLPLHVTSPSLTYA